MTVETEVRVSPLHAYAEALAAVEERTRGRVRLAEIPFLAKTNVRGDAGGSRWPFPLDPGTSAVNGAATTLILGPDEWLVIGDAEPAGLSSGPGLSGMAAAAGMSTVDVSAQFTVLALGGPARLDVLAGGCALDLAALPDGWCVQTMLARASVVLWSSAPDEIRILVRSSYARYVADWLLDALIDLIAWLPPLEPEHPDDAPRPTDTASDAPASSPPASSAPASSAPVSSPPASSAPVSGASASGAQVSGAAASGVLASGASEDPASSGPVPIAGDAITGPTVEARTLRPVPGSAPKPQEAPSPDALSAPDPVPASSGSPVAAARPEIARPETVPLSAATPTPETIPAQDALAAPDAVTASEGDAVSAPAAGERTVVAPGAGAEPDASGPQAEHGNPASAVLTVRRPGAGQVADALRGAEGEPPAVPAEG